MSVFIATRLQRDLLNCQGDMLYIIPYFLQISTHYSYFFLCNLACVFHNCPLKFKISYLFLFHFSVLKNKALHLFLLFLYLLCVHNLFHTLLYSPHIPLINFSNISAHCWLGSNTEISSSLHSDCPLFLRRFYHARAMAIQ